MSLKKSSVFVIIERAIGTKKQYVLTIECCATSNYVKLKTKRFVCFFPVSG
jgi:hypothetical protein